MICCERNGFGGKIEVGESVEQAALRELHEECSLTSLDLKQLGYLNFHMMESNLIMRVHVFESWLWEGEATESDEMLPQWYNVDEMPFDKMWPDDIHWMHFLLERKRFLGR